jgi:hypothetical protein
MGDPGSDSRNALLVQGSLTEVTANNCTFKNVGVYIWTGADAKLTDCRITGGLHGLYIWGACDVSAVRCQIQDTELSGINIRDGAKARIEVRFHPNPHVRPPDAQTSPG